MPQISVNRILSLIKVLFILFLIFGLLYQINPYSIANNQQSIVTALKQFGNLQNNSEITILKEVNIDNKKFLLYNYEFDNLVLSELTKGFFNKYKIEHQSTFYPANARIIKTNSSSYVITSGKKLNKEVSIIKVFIENEVYSFDISNKDYFIEYTPIENFIDITITKIVMYDDDGNIIK